MLGFFLKEFFLNNNNNTKKEGLTFVAFVVFFFASVELNENFH